MCGKISIDEITIPVPLGKYEEFIRIEDRVGALVERYKHGEYLSEEDVLWAIGTKEAREEAVRRAEKNKVGGKNEQR